MALLTQEFGETDWIHQLGDAVRVAVHRGVTQWAGVPPPVRAESFDRGADYKFEARTAEELKATAHLVPGANAKEVPRELTQDEIDALNKDAAKGLAATTQRFRQEYQEREAEEEAERREHYRKLFAEEAKQKGNGWAL